MLKNLKKKHCANSYSTQIPMLHTSLLYQWKFGCKQLGKEHKNVISDLENLLSSSNVSQLIIESSYKANNGQEFLMVEK